jgi:hypothetical protein
MQPCPLSLGTWSFVLASFSKRLPQLDLFNQGRFRRTKNFGGRCCHRLPSAAEIGSTNVLADSTKEWLVQPKTRTIFSVAAVPMWSSVVDFTTRAAKPPIFSVPLVDPPFDGWSKDESSPSRGCVACGNIEASSGGKLLECSACYGAKYCSTKCQREDWRNHKRHCGRQSKQVLI